MNGIFESLHWTLSALAALIVVAASIVSGIDLWVALERSGAAFAIFWGIGLIGRFAFNSSATRLESSAKSVHPASHEHNRAE